MKDIIEKHRSDGRRLCYAESLGPVTAKHEFSGAVEARILRCTRPLGHTDEDTRGGSGMGSQHRDGNCCWSPHRFDEGMATKPQPEFRNLEQCVECRQEWPCTVAEIAEGIEKERQNYLDLVNAVEDIVSAWDGGDLAGAVNRARVLVED